MQLTKSDDSMGYGAVTGKQPHESGISRDYKRCSHCRAHGFHVKLQRAFGTVALSSNAGLGLLDTPGTSLCFHLPGLFGAQLIGSSTLVNCSGDHTPANR
jgi:hypothetical protein